MNMPPTPAQLERIAEWSHTLDHLLENCPITFDHGFNDDGGRPVHTWMGRHGTIPMRALVVQFGIPAHEPDCQCIGPVPLVAQIEIRDLDTEERAPETGAIELIDPSTDSGFFSLVIQSVGLFATFGNL